MGAHLVSGQLSVLGTEGVGEQQGDGATEQLIEESAAEEDTGAQHDAVEDPGQRGSSRLVLLDPGLQGHQATIPGNDVSSSDSDSNSCSDDETDDDDDRSTLASHVTGVLTGPEQKLLPILVKLAQPEQNVLLQTVSEVSSEPKQVRWKSGLELRAYLDDHDDQVIMPAAISAAVHTLVL